MSWRPSTTPATPPTIRSATSRIQRTSRRPQFPVPSQPSQIPIQRTSRRPQIPVPSQIPAPPQIPVPSQIPAPPQIPQPLQPLPISACQTIARDRCGTRASGCQLHTVDLAGGVNRSQAGQDDDCDLARFNPTFWWPGPWRSWQMPTSKDVRRLAAPTTADAVNDSRKWELQTSSTGQRELHTGEENGRD